MNSLKEIKIGKFLFEREGRYKPDDKIVSDLKRLEKIDFQGVFHIGDKSSNTGMILVKPGDFVISGINVTKGAMGIYSGEEDAAATIHYSSYTFDEEIINVGYFKRFLKSKVFVDLLKEQVKGGIKTEIKPKHILPLKIYLPDKSVQDETVNHFENIEGDISDLATEITRQQTFLKKLRQSILQDAISGKLTEQWRKKNPDVEPASELLKRIKEEKERLIKEKKIPKQKPLPPISDDESPFQLPKGWIWCRLQDITTLITDGKHGDCQNHENSGFYFLSAKDIQNGKLLYDHARQIIYKDFQEVHNRTDLQPGDICMVNTGATVGKTAIAPEHPYTRKTTFQKSVAVIKMLTPYANNEYIRAFLICETASLLATSWGSAINNLLLGDLKKQIVPLPPGEEQNEIVNRINSANGYCDNLESQITKSQQDAEMLMQAVLKEAFEG